MASFPIKEAQLVALFVQSVTYGIPSHIVTFSVCVRTLVHSSGSGAKPFNWRWLLIGLVLFGVGTIDVSFNLYHNLIAFIFYTGPGGAETQFGDISNWVNVMRSVWTFVQAMVPDAALVWSHHDS